MRTATKINRSFSLDREVLAEVKRTRGTLSESERVNRLLRSALEREKRAALEREIADFFTSQPDDRKERRAFESANFASLARD
jgi:Arc/MetJ family transcription regulator